MSLLQLRENIRNTLAANIPDLRGAYTHGGEFDFAELVRTAVAAPCIVVACLGVNSTAYQAGLTVANAQWGVYVVARGTSQVQRDAQALALVESVLVQVYANDWRADNVGGPRNVTAANRFRNNVDDKGTAIWEIAWDQSVDLSRTVLEVLSPFTGVNTTWNTADSTIRPDATDDIQLEGDLS